MPVMARPKRHEEQLHIRIEPELRAALFEYAARHEVTVSELIRRLIMRQLGKDGRKA